MNLFFLFILLLISIKNVALQCQIDKFRTTLHCNNLANLNELNRINHKERITILEINNSTITNLPENTFINFENLEILKISGNLQEINSNSLGNLNELKQLNLANNYISQIPDDFFVPFSKKLDTVIISFNQFSTLTLDTFYKLNNVINLDVSNNKISYLILGVFDEANRVKELLLNNNEISSLELGVFDELKELTTLDLSFNKISDNIPLGLFDQSNKIKYLYLNNNNITSLDINIFDQLKKLLVLNLSFNKFRKIPLGLFDQNTKLIELNLNGNKQLKSIILGVFDELKNLTTIHLANCNIDNITNFLFDQNKQLVEIDLSFNNFETLPFDIFKNNNKLNYVNLSHNSIQDLNTNLFQFIKILDISFNKFTRIRTNLLNIPTLERLELQNNEILYLDNNAFNSKLEYLDLSYNRLVYFDDKFLQQLTNLKNLEIIGNPWDCKCFDELIEKLYSKTIKYKSQDYFQGKKPVCVVSNKYDCSVNKNKLKAYYNIFVNV